MSADRQDDQFWQALGLTVVVLVLIALVYIWRFSRYIGADFQVTLNAIVASSGFGLLACLIWWKFRPRVITLATFFLMPISVSWWSVIDNITAMLQNTTDLLPPQTLPWWTMVWIRYAVLIFLAASWLILVI